MHIKRLLIGVGLVCILIMAISAFALLRAPAEAGEPIQAIPLTGEETAPATEPAAETDPVAEAGGSAETASDDNSSTGASTIFEIDSDQSLVQFSIDEILRGSPYTAVGTTDQVAGQFAFDITDLTTAELGVIQVNARTLATDDDFRNRAIQNQILDTGQYEFITFTPTSLDGLPGSAGIGETVTFTIAGDLTIRDVTLPVSFEAQVTLVSESEVYGSASTTILRSDYGLTIPSVRQVAEVGDEMDLTIEFVATTG